MCYVLGIIQALGDPEVFEIGTGKGILAKYMAKYSSSGTKITTLDVLPSQLHGDETLYPINPWNKGYVRHGDDQVGEAFKDQVGLKGKIDQIIMDSAVFGQPKNKEEFDKYRKSMDMIIVDGNHSFPSTYQDIKMALEMTRQGGVIVIDDYRTNFLSRYLQRGLVQSMLLQPGLVEAVDKIASDTALEGHKFYRCRENSLVICLPNMV